MNILFIGLILGILCFIAVTLVFTNNCPQDILAELKKLNEKK